MALAFLEPSWANERPAASQSSWSAPAPVSAVDAAISPRLCAPFGLGVLVGLACRLRRSRAARRSLAVTGGLQATELSEVEPHPANLREWRLKVRDQVGSGAWPAPKNDRLLRAARGETVDRAPKWMMRQAGRYLPEYMSLLSHTDFFEVCTSPQLAAEVTLQPFRRYPSLDSLIIFSDILVIPVAMGMPCKMEPKMGPKFDFSLETPEDLKRLDLRPNVDETLGYVFDAVFWTRQRVNNQVPVIGFCGAPWTLMGYMVEGGAVRSFERAKKWLYLYPEASRQLLTALRDIIVEYLVGQFDSGAPLLTVFDTNCGELPPRIYEEFCVADLKYIATEVKRRRPQALLSIFPKDGEIAAFNDSDYDVVGVSWTTSPAEARRMCPDKTLQGNLDPTLLYADVAQVKERTEKMVWEFGVDRYIANLGHGMLPTHPVEGPAAFMAGVDSVARDAAASPLRKEHAVSERSTAPVPTLTLHMEQETTVSIPLTAKSATGLQKALGSFVSLFKEKMAATSAKRWDNLEYQLVQEDLSLEVFCNPNAFATIFDVKVFLTVKCGTHVKVASEVPLSTLQSDLDAFLS